MKVIIAPDSFKESLTSVEATDAIERGLNDVFPDIETIKVPMSDGGEGFVTSLVESTNGSIIETKVMGPLLQTIRSFYGILGDGKTAVIEIAAACGLHLVPIESRNPLKTTSFGVGELIKSALDRKVESIIIGLGGSSTNDGGTGMAQALGVQFFDQDKNELEGGGACLSSIHTMNTSALDPRLSTVNIQVACDVFNPLLGEQGATYVYGPQKGAGEKMISILETGMTNYANVLKQRFDPDIINHPGSGAAGGLGAGLLAFLSAELKSGIELVIEATNLEGHVKTAALIITGEGKIDSQSIYGKTPVGIAQLAKKYNKPLICIAGTVEGESALFKDKGIDAVFSLVPGVVMLENAIKKAPDYLYETSRNIASLLEMKLED
jgi:glycerate 2-kinase